MNLENRTDNNLCLYSLKQDGHEMVKYHSPVCRLHELAKAQNAHWYTKSINKSSIPLNTNNVKY